MVKTIILSELLNVDDDNRKQKAREIENLLVGKNCIFTIAHSNIIRSVKVNSVQVSWGVNKFSFFINEYPVDKDKGIKIEVADNIPDHILGIPSGEVIFTTKTNIDHLRELRYIKYKEIYAYRDFYIKDVYIFSDSSRDDIMYVLNNFSDQEDDDGFGDGPTSDEDHVRGLFGK